MTQLFRLIDNGLDFQAQRRFTAFDTFTRANGAIGRADSGQLWAVGGGTWTVASNAAAAAADGGTGPLVTLPVRRPDGTLSCVVTGTSGVHGLVFRYVDGNNYWMIARDNGVFYGNGVFIHKVVAGVVTLYGPISLPSSPTTFRVAMLGTRIRIEINGVGSAFGTITDAANQLGTRCGLLAWFADGSNRWDSFTYDQRTLF